MSQSLSNAKRLLRDAALLNDNERHASAFALAVLGLEEIGNFRHTLNCQKCKPDVFPQDPKHGHASRKYRTALYDAWANMRQRTNPDSGGSRNRKGYADKGITVCREWESFEPFRDWAVANGWRKGLSLDRIRSSGDYEPSNCEWITRSENSRRAAQDKWRKHDHAPIGAMLSFGV